MIYMFTLFAALLTQAVSAEVITNVTGMTGRLETITCVEGATVTLTSNAQNVYAKAEAECKVSEEAEFDACLQAAIKKYTKFAPVKFRGDAIVGTKQFEMRINPAIGRGQLFYSIREGFHADTNNKGVALMFNRVGITNDEFLIESSRLSQDGNKIAMLMVPVRIRFLPDQLYFFYNCNLNWIH